MAQNSVGETVLLGRNGSDYSATMIGTLAGVQKITIWSDVAGVYSADPRYVEDAFLLPSIHIDEAAELARLAAPVLHTRTLQPVAQNNVELVLQSSHTPKNGSTRMERQTSSQQNASVVTSLQNVCLVHLEYSSSHDFLTVAEKVIQLLEKKKVPPLAHCRLDERNILQLVYTSELASSVLELLQDACVPAKIRLREGFSLIALVGKNVTACAEYCHKFYQQLAQQPLEFLSESNNDLSITAILRKPESYSLVTRIHQALFEFEAEKQAEIL